MLESFKTNGPPEPKISRRLGAMEVRQGSENIFVRGFKESATPEQTPKKVYDMRKKG